VTAVHEKKRLKSNRLRYFHISNQKREVDHFLCSVDRSSLYNLVNETKLAQAFILSVFRQFYLQPLHVSDLSRSIIRRKLYLCNAKYLLFCLADSPICRHTRLSAKQQNRL